MHRGTDDLIIMFVDIELKQGEKNTFRCADMKLLSYIDEHSSYMKDLMTLFHCVCAVQGSIAKFKMAARGLLTSIYQRLKLRIKIK